MAPYVAREASKIWKRAVAEFNLEIKILLEKWRFLLLVLVFQYLHGVAAKGAHFLHQPGRILPDTGFRLLPELGPQRAYISEAVFFSILGTFILWTFVHPFCFYNKRFYTVLLWYRVLIILMLSQILRIVSFLATSLPGPNYHCREGSPVATLPPPKNVWDVVWIDLPYGVIYGCGDLIFSSHMIFTLTFIWTYQKYGASRWMKRLGWLAAIVLSLLIIASRKHYSVDIVVAWYAVALVNYFVDHQIVDKDRESTGPSIPMKSKDVWKEERNGLLNGNSGPGDTRHHRNGEVILEIHTNGIERD